MPVKSPTKCPHCGGKKKATEKMCPACTRKAR